MRVLLDIEKILQSQLERPFQDSILSFQIKLAVDHNDMFEQWFAREGVEDEHHHHLAIFVWSEGSNVLVEYGESAQWVERENEHGDLLLYE